MDPLAQLKDIHLPAEVANYPLAPGWWLVLTITVVTLIYLGFKFKQKAKLNNAKKLALKKLTQCNDLAAVHALFKWAALQYFPRSQVAELSGNKLKGFLIKQLKEKQQPAFEQALGDSLEHVYQKTNTDVDYQLAKQACKLWLQQALPPKGITLKRNKK